MPPRAALKFIYALSTDQMSPEDYNQPSGVDLAVEVIWNKIRNAGATARVEIHWSPTENLQ